MTELKPPKPPKAARDTGKALCSHCEAHDLSHLRYISMSNTGKKIYACSTCDPKKFITVISL